ncbi:hydrogenase [Clostridium carboxidivorans P7]|uniref:Hydrogenase, membrane subunit 3-like protein (EchB-like) n=1 Tax=Clostridium carboxidivorans P7 TaxID=536227 RepID=C6PUG6_9CLOT|nr:NADH-quinone oxidoreductase subunit H [Clostridium carboxidivorans]AKN30537.1 hydrogenase [Clostridium carboxidivorans P7]EET87164.1 hydrogenase, membrane subunit 3-like protein (EchB-like) [Clostridium carboxidivorans P7]EFG86282.1 hydrogenase, HycD subunit family protein [Clostridium carboxidivorans P7]
MKYIAINFLQSMLLIIVTPLFMGILKKFKAILRGYKGSSIFQVYYDYQKLFSKGRIRSSQSGFITQIGPILSLAAAITAVFMIPTFFSSGETYLGSLFLIIFMMSIVKFLNTLIGLDCASTFGGMGTSRELFLSMLAEPVMFLTIMFLYFENKSFNIFTICFNNSAGAFYGIGHILAAISFFILLLTENARLPIDNPETHLELTMIHEAMILDLSGTDLAFVEMASQIKLMIFLTIFINLFMPFGAATTLGAVIILKAAVVFFVKILVILFGISIIEISMTKSRLFRVPELLSAALAIAIAAISLNYFL